MKRLTGSTQPRGQTWGEAAQAPLHAEPFKESSKTWGNEKVATPSPLSHKVYSVSVPAQGSAWGWTAPGQHDRISEGPAALSGVDPIPP